jgi:hypothetical protein
MQDLQVPLLTQHGIVYSNIRPFVLRQMSYVGTIKHQSNFQKAAVTWLGLVYITNYIVLYVDVKLHRSDPILTVRSENDTAVDLSGLLPPNSFT